MRSGIAWVSWMCGVALAASSCGTEPTPPVEPDPCAVPADVEGEDEDGDGVADLCDNCPATPNPDQLNSDWDEVGDACDDDKDDDGYLDVDDLCPLVYHPLAEDADGDGIGDVCDPCPRGEDGSDRDSDGVDDCADLCPDLLDPENIDSDGDGVGDACDVCPLVADASQLDSDGDGDGDACDEDAAFSVVEATTSSIQAAIRAGDVTCAEVVEAHLDLIQRRDKDTADGAPLNAMVMVNPKARDQAAALDAYFAREGELKGPLHCSPFVVKDLFDTAELPVSSGSLSLVDSRPGADGFAVGRIRSRGAILIGTTSMDEFSKGIYGVSSRSGRAGNAYDGDRNAGGSSSGSGVAVGSSFAVAGLGTDNCASLSVPAAYNGLVTLRSSTGVVSLGGIFPSSRLDAVAGPMARTVRDLALFFDAMAAHDPAYDMTRLRDGARPESYLAHLDSDGLRGRRVGVLRSIGRGTTEDYKNAFTRADTHTHQVYSRALGQLEALGATVVENVFLDDLNMRRSGEGAAQDIDAYLARVDGPHSDYRSMCKSDQISKWAKNSDERCDSNHLRATTIGRIGGDSYDSIEERYAENAAYIASVMDAQDLDALVLPVDAYGAARTQNAKTNCVVTSVSGTPSMNIQVGFSEDSPAMPIGMMFIGRRYSEPLLFELAYAYEQGTRHRRPPRRAFTSDDGRDVPPLDVAEFNAAGLEIGQLAFSEVLEDADSRFALSGAVFRLLVQRVTRARGWTWAVEPAP